jgi:hypothetical protein
VFAPFFIIILIIIIIIILRELLTRKTTLVGLCLIHHIHLLGNHCNNYIHLKSTKTDFKQILLCVLLRNKMEVTNITTLLWLPNEVCETYCVCSVFYYYSYYNYYYYSSSSFFLPSKVCPTHFSEMS